MSTSIYLYGDGIYLYGDGSASAPASATPTLTGANTFTSRTDITQNYVVTISDYSTLNALSGATWASPTAKDNSGNDVGTVSRSGATITVVVPIGYEGSINVGIGFTETGKTQSFGSKSTIASLAVTTTPILNAPSTFTSRTDIAQTYNVPITNYTGNYDSATTWVFTGLTGGVTGAYNSANQRLEITVPAGFNGTVAFTAKATATGKAQSADSNTATTNASPAVSATPTITGGTTVIEGNSLTLNVTPVSGASYAWSANEGSITPSVDGDSAVWTPASTGTNRNATITCRVTEVGKLQSDPDTHDVAVSISILGLSGLFTYHSVNDASVDTTQVNQTFTSADVDTGTGNINLNLGFTHTPVDIESAGVNRVGVPVYYSGTGTPPSLVGGGTLQPNTRYYAINNVTNEQLELYPECTESNRHLLIKYSPCETILPQALLYQGVGKLMLSSGGTGTHTIFTNPLINSIPNLVTSLPTPLEITDTNPNAKVEVLTDSDGKKALNFRGSLAKITSATTGHGNTIGEKIALSFGINKTTYRENYANKRYLTMITVANVDDEPYFDNRKNIIAPADINAGTGVISYAGYVHGFPIGANGITEVTIQPTSGSTLPPAMPNYNGATDQTRNTLWVRGLTAGNATTLTKGTYTFHSSYADAKANTNPITYGGGTGSGEFIIGGYAQIVNKPEEHYFSSIDFPIQWAVGSLNGKGVQRLINQTFNTGNYQTTVFGPTNAEITGGLCSAVRGIANMFVTGQSAKGLIQTTVPLKAYPIRLKMGKNAVYPFCTTLGRRLVETDSFWGVPFPTGSSGRGWWFQTKAEADTWASRPGLTTSMNPDGTYTSGGVTPIGLVLDNSQYNFTTPSSNNGFYGWGVWYLGINQNGRRVGLLSTSNVIPTHTVTPLVELDKKNVFATILDLNNTNTTTLKSCGVQLLSVSNSTTYTVTLDGINRSFTSASSGATTTNVLDGLVSVINAQTATTGIQAARQTSTMMHIWKTANNATFSLSVGAGLTIRPFILYKVLANGVEVTNGWEAYNNSDVRYAELLQSGNYVDSPTSDPLYAPCSHIIGSPAQPHVSFKGLMYAYLMAAANTDPTTQLTNGIIPALMTEFAVTA